MLLKRKYLFGSTILAGVMAVTAPALAQSGQSTQLPGVTSQSEQQQEATNLGEIISTGSRLRRDPANAPTPLIQVTRDELVETGQSTVIDYLATIPALSNSMVPSDTVGSLGITGLSFANLRSLGSGRTLTLVDGRRHVGSQGGNLAVDVDTIPRLLIQNVEIITGGASSVYGADAVSGVLNFVLRKDFEGLEIDTQYSQINQNGEASARVSVLGGVNLLDDRLNLYAFGEFEKLDGLEGPALDWLSDGRGVVGLDADPTTLSLGPVNDGILDQNLFYNLRSINRPYWGVTTVANSQRPSPRNNPNVPLGNCTSLTSANCYSVDPAKTYWYDQGVARLVNFGTRVGNTGLNRPFNIGGDGYNNNHFGGFSRQPESESKRFQTGLTFALTNNITAFAELKYVEEDSYVKTQPTFFDVFISNTYPANEVQGVSGNTYWTRRDNAFLPAIINTAMTGNMVTTWAHSPDPSLPGVAGASTLREWARHSAFGPDRTQQNHRELTRYVLGLRGGVDQFAFVKNFDWEIAYTYGESEAENIESGMDKLRLSHALDAVVDTAGVMGSAGAIVCRATLLAKQGLQVDVYNPYDSRYIGGATPGTYTMADSEVAGCKPLNVFGAGNQSQEGLDFIYAEVFTLERNEQENATAFVSGQLWDFWGAGPIGVALGAEYRREFTEAVGRSASAANRLLQLNYGPDMPGVQYESEEWFAEVSLPLFRDSWLGEYAELSGSYRAFDYTTAGDGDVYGVNFVYRPIRDITFKTSYNTSFRAPNLGENFEPYGQTFANGFVDPCDTRQITNPSRDATERANRIANCTALAAAMGLSYDFAGTTADPLDDYTPTYSAGIAGVGGGNPNLKPEESTSFTFSTVIQPRMFPNVSIVLDYYEIEITDVIASVSAQTLANQCVDGAQLNTLACNVIFRRTPATADPSDAFRVGAPAGDPIGGFIEGSFNYASRETRGLDFSLNYMLDTEEAFGRNWGRFNYRIGGTWLMDQKFFNNADDPTDFTERASTPFYPRVRLTQRVNWAPTDTIGVTWTMDWQASQDIVQVRDWVASGNFDNRPYDWLSTGDFVRHDLAVRWDVRDDLTLRAGVTNVFDAEQKPYLGSALYSNFDPYGRRFNVGLSYRPW